MVTSRNAGSSSSKSTPCLAATSPMIRLRSIHRALKNQAIELLEEFPLYDLETLTNHNREVGTRKCLSESHLPTQEVLDIATERVAIPLGYRNRSPHFIDVISVDWQFAQGL